MGQSAAKALNLIGKGSSQGSTSNTVDRGAGCPEVFRLRGLFAAPPWRATLLRSGPAQQLRWLAKLELRIWL